MCSKRRITRLVGFTVAVIAGLALAAPADARASLRCPNGLIQFDDHRVFVLRRCGEPLEVERRKILRRAIVSPGLRSRSRDRDTIILGEAWIGAEEEVWIYNFGPGRFMRQIRFIDGRVRNIESLGYGFID